jgi:hypothetical protein
MIIAILIIIYIFYINTSYGLIVNRVLQSLKIIDSKSVPSFYVCNIVGLCFITGLISFYSLIGAISELANLFVLVFALLYTIFNWQEYKYYVSILQDLISKHRSFVVITSSFFLITLVLMTSFASHIDSGLYHAQAIKWIEEYKVIYGLGNLHGRLAFNSAYFIPSALFSFSFIWSKGFHLLNGYLAVLLIGSIFYYWLVKNSKSIYFFLLVLLLGFLFIRNFLSSPTTDVSSFIIIVLLALIFMNKAEQSNTKIVDFDFFSIFFICFLIITIKLSNAIIILLPLYLFWITWRLQSLRSYFVLALAGIFIILPWLIRNVILSGYLIYPLEVIDIFDVDWKIPLVSAEYDNSFYIHSLTSEKNFIKSWAMMPRKHWKEVLHLPLLAWLIPWFKGISLYYKGLIVSSLMFSAIVPLHYFFLRKNKEEYSSHLFAFWVISLLCIIFCLSNAPSLRFAYAFITIFLSLSLFLILPNSLFNLVKKFEKLTLLGVLLLYIVIIANEVKNKKISWDADFWWQPSGFPISKLKSKNTDSQLTIFFPEIHDDGCWYTDKPCSPYIHHSLKLRGQSVEDGFRIVK